MSIENMTQAKAEISNTSAYKVMTEFFDEGSFIEIGGASCWAKTSSNVIMRKDGARIAFS